MLRTVSALLIDRVLIFSRCPLLRAGFCVTRLGFHDAFDERLFDHVWDACAEFRAKPLDVGHLNQAKRARAKIGNEIARKKLLIDAPRRGSNCNLAVEPAKGCIFEGPRALVHQSVRHLGDAICE